MKKKVRLMLKENVEGLGLLGEEVTVALGYAKNYLIPKQLVVLKDDPNYKKLLEEVKGKKALAEKELEEFKKAAEKIFNQVVKFKSRVAESGKLFGSVTAEDIADKIGVDKKYIITSPLKQTGSYLIKIKFPQKINSQIKVEIEGEQGEQKDRRPKTEDKKQVKTKDNTKDQKEKKDKK